MSNQNIVGFVNDQQVMFSAALTSDSIVWEKESQFAIQALQGNDYLNKAAVGNPAAMQNAIINVAAVGISLNPALKHAYLVPRSPGKGKPPMVFLDISYQGLLHIAMTSGSIEWGQAKIVYANDQYENSGIDKAPLHKQNTFGDKGAIVGAYCTVKTAGGDYLTEEMDLESLQKTANTSKASNGPWKMWWSEMARKTVVKRASKYWPKADRVNVASNVLNEHEGLTDDFTEKDVTPTQVTVSQEQAASLIEAAVIAGVDEAYICSKARVASIHDIEASRYEAAINHLKGLGIKHEDN